MVTPSSEKEPAGTCRHAARPAVGAYQPAAQRGHDDAALPAAEPAAQIVQLVTLAADE